MKGLGYSIEVMASIFILIAFAATGFTVSQADQDWQNYQHQVTSEDLSYVLRDSGHLNHFLKNRELGGIKTATQVITGRGLKVSGSVSNLPLKETSIGFNTMPYRIYGQSLEEVTAGDRCHGDLEEITRKSNTDQILKSDGTGRSNVHGVTLYFADTDPRNTTGDDGKLNYESVWVDNGTECQFDADEGPYYTDQFFYWAGGSKDTHYELKDVDYGDMNATVYEAEQVIQFRETMSKRVNGIDTSVSFDTFRYDTDPISIYDLVVFRNDSSLTWINSDETKLKNFMNTGSTMLLMELTESDLGTGFLKDTGLKWVDLGVESGSTDTEGQASFSNSDSGKEVSTYFTGQDGREGDTGMAPQGKVTSSRSDTLTSDDIMVYTMDVMYRRDEWNATNMSLESGDGGLGSPSGCDVHHGNFTFPAPDPDIEYRGVVTELGNCDDIHGLNLDLDGDGDATGNDEGPFLHGEELVIDGLKYKVRFYPTKCSPTEECAELVFNGPRRMEVVNFRESFPGFDGQRLARAGYESQFETHDRKVLASVLYWLRGNQVKFSADGSHVGSTSITGGIKNRTYMPYSLDLRWWN